jgi:hypothetical protein
MGLLVRLAFLEPVWMVGQLILGVAFQTGSQMENHRGVYLPDLSHAWAGRAHLLLAKVYGK